MTTAITIITVFFADPTREDRYINADDYFLHIRKARVQELVRIAEDLGASHVSIEYLISEKMNEKNEMEAMAEAGGGEKKRKTKDHDASDTRHKAGVAVDSYSSGKNYYENAVKTTYDMEPRDPVRPELIFFKNDDDIRDLIRMRMDGRIKNHTYLVSCIKSIGIKKTDAEKIDGALKQMKCKAKVSVERELEEESRVSMKYTVVF